MKRIGIFEAKTHFPGLCDEVVRLREPVLVERRGKPLVVIGPAPGQQPAGTLGILDAWREWQAANAEPSEADFPEVWKARKSRKNPPVDS